MARPLLLTAALLFACSGSTSRVPDRGAQAFDAGAGSDSEPARDAGQPDAAAPPSDASSAGDARTSDAEPQDASAPLALPRPGPQEVREEEELRLSLEPSGGSAATRLFLEGLPPGASFSEAEHLFRYRPDFTEGPRRWQVRMTAVDGQARLSDSFEIHVLDSIQPPAPVITRTEPQNGWSRLTVTQITDRFLDSPGYAGRRFDAVVSVPSAPDPTHPLPVRVGLHGFGASPENSGWSGEFRIFPADPMNSYWWGYSDQLPGAPPDRGTVPDYTVRRVLHLLAWLLQTQPAADPRRVYVEGDSMGGAGAMTIGLLHARHFCHVRAGFGQAIPKNHRPSRIFQLSGLWGAPGAALSDGDPLSPLPAWDRMDLTRVLRDHPEASDQFLSIKHSKDDPLVHFGAVVTPSALTGATLYGALQGLAIGHHAIWDEGGHLVPDPVLHDGWWTAGWNPVFDTTALLKSGLAFPAFSRAAVDRDPGTDRGNGRRAFDPQTGFAGDVSVAGDTGWDGDLAGGLNRFLRWDGTRVVDTLDRFEVPLRVLDGAGGPPPMPGYPTTGDKLEGNLPVQVDVTPRRTQSFRCRPGETIRWQFGGGSGIASADPRGSVTVRGLPLDTTWTTLILSRVP